MKAAFTRYGPPDVVVVGDLPKPVPKDNEVLIKVRAAAVNPLDWRTMKGGPGVLRLLLGQRRPKIKPLGVDVAGVVEAVGRKVTEFKPGDAVFGTCRGAFAEYACTSQSAKLLKTALAIKPDNVTFEQAACTPIGGLTALQGLRDKGKIQPGNKVLINGAAGGVGTFAVQIAKSFGAHVTAVCSTRNVEMVRSIGADRIIDYTREDFTRSEERYDLLLDNVGNRPLSACRRVLASDGSFVMVGAPHDVKIVSTLAKLSGMVVLSGFVKQRLVFFVARSNGEDLMTLAELMTTQKIMPVVDRRFPLSEVPEALDYLEAGHAQGKVVITFGDDFGS